MGLLDRFRDTVFLKSEGNLERQIEDLKRLPNYVSNKDILRDIKVLEYGLQGEREIAFELMNANIGMFVLHDITIAHNDLKAQIDYVIVTRGYTYLVECKNLIGNISVDSSGNFKREYDFGGKKYKEAIYSPYTQAVRHKDILKKKWLSSNNKIYTLLSESRFDSMWYKPLVVIANSKSILNTKYAPKEIRENTIRVDQLVRFIEDDLRRYNKNFLMNEKKMLELANRLLKANSSEYVSVASKYGDIPPVKIKSSINEDVILELKKFRKEKSKSMRVPAYYIFTDEELDRIVKCFPKSVEELEDAKILSTVKLRYHGKEIISILNKSVKS